MSCFFKQPSDLRTLSSPCYFFHQFIATLSLALQGWAAVSKKRFWEWDCFRGYKEEQGGLEKTTDIRKGTQSSTQSSAEWHRWQGSILPPTRADMNDTCWKLANCTKSHFRKASSAGTILHPLLPLISFHKHARHTQTHRYTHMQILSVMVSSQRLTWCRQLACSQEGESEQNRTEQMLATGKCWRRDTERHAEPEGRGRVLQKLQ